MEKPGEQGDGRPNARKRWQRTRIWLAVLGILLAAAGAGAYLIVRHRDQPPVTVPQALLSSLPYPVYAPKKLPGSFKLVAKSFDISEHSVLVFRADDASGATIAFTEQARPQHFNFTDFYRQNIKDGKVLDGTTYSSYTGKTFDNKANILSVITGDTWILATTMSPLTDQQFKQISDSLYLYRRPQ